MLQLRSDGTIPEWASQLNNYYWRVRVQYRNKTTRRKYYRLIQREKLRLAEAGISMHKINAVCKYLVSLKEVNADRMHIALESEPQQLTFDFGVNSI